MKIKKFNEGVKYTEYFTVNDLIEHLKQFDGDLPVGVTGHFGEFHPLDSIDFYKGEAKLNPKGVASGIQGWRKLTLFPYSNILCITPYDLGPDPD